MRERERVLVMPMLLAKEWLKFLVEKPGSESLVCTCCLNLSPGEKPYKKHINRDNPLGMGGALADTYGHLLEEMWSGSASYLAPRQFKVGKEESSLSRSVGHVHECFFHIARADHDRPPCPAILRLSAARQPGAGSFPSGRSS